LKEAIKRASDEFLKDGRLLMAEKIKAWITKHALTEGIVMVDAEVSGEGRTISYGHPGFSVQYAHGKDWHRTPEAAIARAEEMLAAKIKSLKKSIEKLECLTIKAPIQ
jgi:hypothetical protein